MPPPPRPVKIGHKKMAADGGRLYFMFLARPLSQVSGSAAVHLIHKCLNYK